MNRGASGGPVASKGPRILGTCQRHFPGEKIHTPLSSKQANFCEEDARSSITLRLSVSASIEICRDVNWYRTEDGGDMALAVTFWSTKSRSVLLRDPSRGTETSPSVSTSIARRCGTYPSKVNCTRTGVGLGLPQQVSR